MAIWAHAEYNKPYNFLVLLLNIKNNEILAILRKSTQNTASLNYRGAQRKAGCY